MGQYKTYNDYTLAKRLVRAEQDLVELKANQIYFMNSVAGFESQFFEFNVETKYEWDVLQVGWVGLLDFTGDKPEKDVLIVPKVECLDSNGNIVNLVSLWSEDNVSNGYPAIQLSVPYKDEDRSNICHAVLKISASRYGVSMSRFAKVRIWCVSNDIGVLKVTQEPYEWY